ncbi:MAG TPA: serine hydrolase domain-containing protein [Hyphomonadaceae bacterium]|nr:serine hydrolase domain-containing protein [Hyphomonadaceae bacterium]
MMRIASLLVLVLAAAAPAAAQARSAFPDNAAITKLLKDRVDDGRATGLVVGVMDADGSTRIVSYGSAGAGAEPLGANSVFEIGSITKVFTATVLADMARKGQVKLDAPAQTYAPAGMVLPRRGDKQITLLNLSEQNSGLPRMPSNFRPSDAMNRYADYSVDQLNAFLGGYQLPRDIGATFEYSNLGVGVLGAILANTSGKSYEAMVQDRVLRPLGMTMTGIALTPAMKKALAKGHDPAGGVTANWDLPTLAGAGALRSNMTDMLKFLDANVGPPKDDLERAMRDAQKPRAPAGPNMQIGLNWLTTKTRSGVEYVWHNGGTGGYRSFIGFDPARQVGVVVLSNQAISADDIGAHLLDPTLPLTPKPAPPVERAAITLPTDALAKFVGVYALDTARLQADGDAGERRPAGPGDRTA